MRVDSTPTFVVACIGSVIGDMGGRIMHWLRWRRKTTVETEKSIAETDTIRAEPQKLNTTVPATTNEQILFDGSDKITESHVKGEGGHIYARSGENVHTVGARGEGELTIVDEQILRIVHTNTDGRYEVLIQKYTYDGRTSSVIPKNDAIVGKRIVRISCEARTGDGNHTVRFVICNPETGQRLAQDIKNINGREWTSISIFLQADPSQHSEIRIYHEAGSVLPSSVQIRKLIVAEQRE